jgi:hypothetical protein
MGTNGTLVQLESHCIVDIQTSDGIRPCGHVFKHLPIDAVPIIGQQQRNVEVMADGVATHVRKKHSEVFQAGVVMSMNFNRLMALRTCDAPQHDPGIAAFVVSIEAILRAMSRLQLTDKIIQESVENVLRQALASDHSKEEIESLLKTLTAPVCGLVQRTRNYLTQADLQAPGVQKSQLVGV